MIYGRRKFLHESQELIDEAYFGKTNALKEVEVAIHNIRKDFSISKDYACTPEMIAIENAFKKQFGMDYMYLVILPERTMNAGTYVVGVRYDCIKSKALQKYVIADSVNGFRFKPNNGLVIFIVITAGIMMNSDISDAEIVAILLHEVGHNFADIISDDVRLCNESYYKTVALYLVTKAMINVYNSMSPDAKKLLSFTNGMNDNYDLKNYKKNEKQKDFLQQKILYIKARRRENKENWKLFWKRIKIGFSDADEVVDGIEYSDDIKKSAKRQSEVIADKFAAIYGYSEELASALIKIEIVRAPADNVLKLLPFGTFILIKNRKVSSEHFKFTAHPHFIQRCNTMISALEFEMKKKNIDPELKKELQEQVNALKVIKKEFAEITEDTDKVDAVVKTYAAIVDDKYPEATTAKLEKEINQSIDDLCTGKKKIK